MSFARTVLGRNVEILNEFENKGLFTVAYCDIIYESKEFDWIVPVLDNLKSDGVIMVQTDYHSVAEIKLELDKLGLVFINWIVTHENWGGRSKRCFGRKHDDILIYSLSKNYFFNGYRVAIRKATANTAFDKKGTGIQIPTDNWHDLGNFSTIALERIKGVDGKNIRWQKSLKLMNRLLLPFTNEEDLVLDPFMGTATAGVWCKLNNRSYLGIESNKEVYEIACKRLDCVI